MHSGINLDGILGDPGYDPEGLVGGEGWAVRRGILPPGKQYMERPPFQKKMNFSLEMACFGEF